MSCQDDDTDVTILSPLAGDYIGVEAEDPETEYAVHVYNSANDNNTLFIDNIGNIHNRYTFTVNGNEVSIPSTPYTYVASATVTYTGNLSATGKIEGEKMTLQYTITGPASFLGPTMTYTGNFVGDRGRHE